MKDAASRVGMKSIENGGYDDALRNTNGVGSCVGIFASVLMLAVSDVARSDGPVEHALFGAIRRGDQVAVGRVCCAKGAGQRACFRRHDAVDARRRCMARPKRFGCCSQHGADPNAMNNSKATALLFAAGDLEKVRLLIDAGANVNARSSVWQYSADCRRGARRQFERRQVVVEAGAPCCTPRTEMTCRSWARPCSPTMSPP